MIPPTPCDRFVILLGSDKLIAPPDERVTESAIKLLKVTVAPDEITALDITLLPICPDTTMLPPDMAEKPETTLFLLRLIMPW